MVEQVHVLRMRRISAGSTPALSATLGGITKMAYGYSQTMAHQIKEKHKANPSDPLLELLDICVANDIAPSLIAMALHVSKQTVYDWIANKYSPRLYTQGDIKALLKIYRKEYKKKG